MAESGEPSGCEMPTHTPVRAGVRLQPAEGARPEPTKGLCGGRGRGRSSGSLALVVSGSIFTDKRHTSGSEGTGGGPGSLIYALASSGRSCELS